MSGSRRVDTSYNYTCWWDGPRPQTLYCRLQIVMTLDRNTRMHANAATNLLVSNDAYLAGSICRQRWKNFTCLSLLNSLEAAIFVYTKAIRPATGQKTRMQLARFALGGYSIIGSVSGFTMNTNPKSSSSK